MPKLSIIIPVYNVELYLEKCLSTIFLNIAAESVEVIIINDGTTDKSMDIVDLFLNIYQNIKVFSQENRGLGEARNVGINLATGEYIWFVDSDDWISEGAIDRICKLIEFKQTDIIAFEYEYQTGKKSTIYNNAKAGKIYSGKEYLNINLVESPVWTYVIKTSFIHANKLFFAPIYHEDLLFTTNAFFKASSVAYDKSTNYVYNLRENSIITNSSFLKHCYDLITVIEKLDDIKQNNALNIKEKKTIAKYIILAFNGFFFYLRRLKKDDKKCISKSFPYYELYSTLLLKFHVKSIFKLIIVKCNV